MGKIVRRHTELPVARTLTSVSEPASAANNMFDKVILLWKRKLVFHTKILIINFLNILSFIVRFWKFLLQVSIPSINVHCEFPKDEYDIKGTYVALYQYPLILCDP